MKQIATIILMSLLALISCSAQEKVDVENQENTNGPLFRIGVVTDVHHSATKEATPERCYQASAGKLREAVKTFNEEKVNLVVSLGDLVDNEVDSYSVIDAILDSLDMPVYKIAGNHDYMVPFVQSTQDRIMEMMGIEQPYFSIPVKDYRLIFLDTSEISTHANEKGTDNYIEANDLLQYLKEQEAPNAKKYNGAIGGRQMNWLKKQLKTADKNGEKIICLTHMPLIPTNGKYSLWNAEDLISILEKWTCVKAVFSGHDHRGGYATDKNIHFITFCGVVQGDTNSYAIADVYPDKIIIKGYGRETDRELEHLR